jgi:hypothetical protein
MITAEVVIVTMIFMFFIGIYVIQRIIDKWNEWNQNR